MMHTLDCFLCGFKWWRRLRGGVWRNVTPYWDWSISAWVRGKSLGCERVNAVEEYR